ncbi:MULTISPECIES: acetyl-CoA acetyltransferase [Rhodobacterales]|uniref:3-ketoacyl-CoA thiolase n=3 Tax=Rhodobacterales TaxID=204455 RepID=A0A0P1INK2_9RHOB|nr:MULTISPECIES: acetyl-CoA acetyltransferase [Rhodobacterales]CUH58744.1 3-ketoacyl-CoA thiolase [Thalassobacter stenotrophicus]CUI94061.1 3-ketoacyl-CoA thiolase [Cognatishimia activa]CUK25203.1 3-ketoacyl-CoA thiolase [Cognatishimia activa]SHJ39048.1 acetyl-CoA C-acetyltransferase [Thalassobacter stenotrophicus DSM 16310]
MTSKIVGWAHTKFGKLEAEDVEALIAEVTGTALSHAEVDAQDVDGVFVGVLNNGFSKQGMEGALVALNIPELTYTPAVHLENACATGSAALYAAMDFIEAGRGKIALVIGAEKMTAKPVAETGDILLSASYRKEEGDIPGGFAGVFGQIAQSYFQRYGDKSYELGLISAKNHANGVHNPYAHMQKDFGVPFCTTVSEKNPYVAAPLRRTDCSLISDGAAAIVLMHEDVAIDAARAIGFRARIQVNDILPLSRRDPTAFEGARRAWADARETAGITMGDLDFVETHDCFTMAEMIEYEAMGLAEPGKGAALIRDGYTHKDGTLPVNPSGGLKSKGHPVGATGVSQHIMACMQLMDDAGGMQIKGAETAGVFNMGGAAVANYVSILERSK